MNIIEQLKTIVPGKTYPRNVKVTEKGQKTVEFHLNSFFVGMYCAIHIDGKSMPAVQTGDHNNKRFCRGLKRDLNKALARGATVEISGISNCQLSI